MTTEAQELVRKHLPILQAFAEGKTIQYRYRDGDWRDWPANEAPPSAPLGGDEFRIKPEPVMTGKYRRYVARYTNGYGLVSHGSQEAGQARRTATTSSHGSTPNGNSTR